MKKPYWIGLLMVTGLLMGAGCQGPEKAQEEKKAFTLRIQCGSERDWTDAVGRLWEKDRPWKEGQWGRVGGRAESVEGVGIRGTEHDELYRRQAVGMQGYRIPLANGRYRVQLHFAEISPQVAKAGDRVFSVMIEGYDVLSDLDIFQAVGANAALVKAYMVEVIDGELTIEFSAKQGEAAIAGIEVLQP